MTRGMNLGMTNDQIPMTNALSTQTRHARAERAVRGSPDPAPLVS